MRILIFLLSAMLSLEMMSATNKPKKISKDLFGIFIEDLNYTADGGLYAELVQNRSFEYAPSDVDANTKNTPWDNFTAWTFLKSGNGIGTLSLESKNPLNESNPHYVEIKILTSGKYGVGIRNSGYDGIVLNKGKKYVFSAFIRNPSSDTIPARIRLITNDGKIIAQQDFFTNGNQWQKYSFTLVADNDTENANIELLFTRTGIVDVDMVSLFPVDTYKNRPNGLRADLAETIAEIHPAFVRFPGGCLSHGDGLANIYRWKNTIGPIESRKEDYNIWNYHQTFGLGYYEYLQFCEDIGAKPLPVIAAGVSCQNSARSRGNGQQCIPMKEMDGYIQDILDLIEYCNGPVNSLWGKKRADAGHPKPFGLEYIGIGNEDKITPEFEIRFEMIFNAIKKNYPKIKIVGTVGPSPEGEDFDKGWNLANRLHIPIIDEHCYQNMQWFENNLHRYDNYSRKGSQIYVGEYASRGNTLGNALSEAAYMINMERNGDIVKFASYAPLLARIGYTQWNPDLIYFDKSEVYPTVNYYVQKLFCSNRGNLYWEKVVSVDGKEYPSASCVQNTETGDVIIKMINNTNNSVTATIKVPVCGLKSHAELVTIKGNKDDQITKGNPNVIKPQISTIDISSTDKYDMPPFSLSVIIIKKSGIADKPLFRDPKYDGAADPVIVKDEAENKWMMFYTNRRANIKDNKGVEWVHGTSIGIAESYDGGATWKYRCNANINYGKGYTYWAPEIVEEKGMYHMFLTVVPGIFQNWAHERQIVHLQSKNLIDWYFINKCDLSSERVIDACLVKGTGGKWLMYYNNEADSKSIYCAESDDFIKWKNLGKVISDRRGEGPNVFFWHHKYFMIVDNWAGQGVYSSTDMKNWTRQKKDLLSSGGIGLDDGTIGLHADVLVDGEKAYIFYFTHPERTAYNRTDNYATRRTCIQVAELEYVDGEIVCDRNKPVKINLK